MYYSLLILFICSSARALDTAKTSTANNGSIVLSMAENKEKLFNSTEISEGSSSVPPSTSFSDLSSTTPKYISEESLTKNITNISPKKLPEISMGESEMTNNSSKTSEMVITEGGNSVSTLGSSVTTFQSSQETSGKRILTEGGDRGIISDKVDSVHSKPNVTQILTNANNISKNQDLEGISSMNKGKISARKGVNDTKLMNSVPFDNSHLSNRRIVTHTPVIIPKDEKHLQTNSINISHERKAKPEVTDDRNESNVNGNKKIDYIVPIVCTTFSVPLLIVLGIYLYKKGSDFWERRHYNRMDFLIEGIYNE